MINILYIGNTPLDREQLNLDTEYKTIEVQCSKYQDSIALESLINPTLNELISKLREWKPQLIHFGGNGHPNQQLAIITTTTGDIRTINAQDFEYIINAFDESLEVLVLNASYGQSIAQQLIQSDKVNCIISFKNEVASRANLIDYITILYQEILSGELIKDAVELSNITIDFKFSITWNKAKNINSETFRLKDPKVSTLQEGKIVQGKKLIEQIGQDNLSNIWRVTDGGNFNLHIRRFLKRRLDKNELNKVKTNLINILHLLKDEPGVLTPMSYDLNCDTPFVEYHPGAKFLWKPLSTLVQDLTTNYPLNKVEIDEVCSIIFQLAQIIDTAHHIKDDLIHGFINPFGIIVMDRHSSESATFGNLRPIITDFGLAPLFSRKFKNTSPFLSSWIKKGNTPRKADDVFALVCLWYWLLTGKEPTSDNINQIYDWYAGLDDSQKVDFRVTKIIKDTYNKDSKNNNLSSREFVEILRQFVPSHKLEGSFQKESIEEFTNSLGMKFSILENGQYTMGSDPVDMGFQLDEKPRRLIYLKEFCMSQCVLTIENLIDIAITSGDPTLMVLVEPLKNSSNKKLPATTIFQDGSERKISWQFAKMICEVLTSLPEEQRLGLSYHLPTEAQWEIACRAGTTSVFNTGLNELSSSNANYKSSNSNAGTLKPIQTYPPNRWGLYEMHGNVWEFCADYYANYDTREKRNPKGFQPRNIVFNRLIGNRFSKVIRGGDYQSFSSECRSANRAFIEDRAFGASELHEPDDNHTVGIRLVCYTVSMV